jgi:reactive intermediate/imine deaminase
MVPTYFVDAPAAIGPYSQAIKAGNLVFASGCIPLDPSTMQIVPGGIEEQTKQALKNLKAVVEASGSSIDKVVKTTVSYIIIARFQTDS